MNRLVWRESFAWCSENLVKMKLQIPRLKKKTKK